MPSMGISGLKKSLRAVVQPKDLPSALALAREAEASIERSIFATSYAKAVEERAQTSGNGKGRFQNRQGKDNKEEQGQDRNPHFVRRQKGNGNGQTNNDNQAQAPQPMEVDSSSKFRQRTEYNTNKPNESNASKRRNSSDRSTGPRRQRLNNVVQETPKTNDSKTKDPKQEYEKAAKAAVDEIDSDNEYAPSDDSLNFLGGAPSCRSLNDGWLGGL